MSAYTLREIARALGGEVNGGQVLAPGPGHGPRDRSMSVRPTPNGFAVHSFAGDDRRDCHVHVRALLGLSPDDCKNRRSMERKAPPLAVAADSDTRTAAALALWRQGVDPRGTMAERYLASRELELGDDLPGVVLRWHAGVGAMLALFCNIATGKPQAISRTFLDGEARKLERKFLGPVGGAAIMLDTFDAVLAGLHIAEGVETAMAARQLGLRPAWAVGSCGAVASFPFLPGVQALTLLAENDAASARAVEACANRWHAAGREVRINRPLRGKDLADAIRGPV